MLFGRNILKGVNLMKTITDLSFEEFKELIYFLSKDVEKNNIFKVLKRFERFVPLTIEQEISMLIIVDGILNSKGIDFKQNFEEFKKIYPELLFDPEGKQEILKQNYLLMELKTCEMLYIEAQKQLNEGKLGKNNINKQIVYAKTLEPLMNISVEEKSFYIERALYLKNPKSKLTLEQFKYIENLLDDVFADINKTNIIMNKLLFYIKKENNIDIFIRYFKLRLFLLVKKSNNEISKSFKENLEKLIYKF